MGEIRAEDESAARGDHNGAESRPESSSRPGALPSSDGGKASGTEDEKNKDDVYTAGTREVRCLSLCLHVACSPHRKTSPRRQEQGWYLCSCTYGVPVWPGSDEIILSPGHSIPLCVPSSCIWGHGKDAALGGGGKAFSH